jgi:RNA polymerase sigma factor (sigma-70 family)
MAHQLAAPDAFGRFYAEHRPLLERLARRITADPDAAQDVVANAVIRVWQRLQDGPAPDQPLAYLVRAVQNEARDHLRRSARAQARQRALVAGTATAGAAAAQPGSAVEDRDALECLLPALSDLQRRTLELRYLGDLPDAEIAELLGVRPPTVRSLAHRGLSRLRQRASAQAALGGAR